MSLDTSKRESQELGRIQICTDVLMAETARLSLLNEILVDDCIFQDLLENTVMYPLSYIVLFLSILDPGKDDSHGKEH